LENHEGHILCSVGDGCGLHKHSSDFHEGSLRKSVYRCKACQAIHDEARREAKAAGRPFTPAKDTGPITAGEREVTSTQTVKDWRGPWSRAVQRRGQGRSAFSGALNFEPGLLESAHIRAEQFCETLDQKRDVHNGLLATRSEHKMFEEGYLGLDLEGNVLFSSELTPEEWRAHGFDVNSQWRIPAELWTPQMIDYAFWHFNNIYRNRDRNRQSALEAAA
jgi:hypothetical protein